MKQPGSADLLPKVCGFSFPRADEPRTFKAGPRYSLLPVLILLDLLAAHSQEWLCHQTFSAAC